MRGRFDAVVSVPEIDAIQVRLEDGALRVALLEPPRQNRFLDLAGVVLLAIEQNRSHQLLRDGAAALDDLAGALLATAAG